MNFIVEEVAEQLIDEKNVLNIDDDQNVLLTQN